MTELEGKNSLLGTDLVHKTDQQQLLQGTVRQETCTQENCITVERENYLGARDRFVRSKEFTNKCNYRGSAPSIYLLLFFITNTKEFASFCLCVLYSGRSTVHAETPSSRICDKRFFHCGPYVKGGAPNSGRFLIPDKRSFMLDFSETHWCILTNLIPQVDLS